jgi:hypothetical protein
MLAYESSIYQAPEIGDKEDKKGIRSQSGIGLDLEESKVENGRLGRREGYLSF